MKLSERTVRWARRHPGVAFLSAALTAAIVIGAVLVLQQWREAVTQRDLARDESAAKEKALGEKESALGEKETARAAAAKAETQARQDRDDAQAALRQERVLRYAGRLTDAQRYTRDQQALLALETLDGCPEDLHGWEWHYLKRAYEQRRPRVLFGTSESWTRPIFSPDGQRLAVAGPGYQQARLWDVSSGRLLHSFTGVPAHFGQMTFTPDGRQLFAATTTNGAKGPRGEFRVCDTATGQVVQTLNKEERLQRAAATPDGHILISSLTDWKLKVWDARADKPLAGFTGERKVVEAAFSPDGRLLAVVPMQPTAAFADRFVELYDTASGELKQKLEGHQQQVRSLVFSPDSKRLASFTRRDPPRPGELCVWDCTTGQLLRVLAEADKSEFKQVVFSADGKRLAVVVTRPVADGLRGNDDVSVLDPTAGKEVIPTQRFTNQERIEVAFAPNSQQLALLVSPIRVDEKPGEIRLLDLGTGRELVRLTPPLGTITQPAFSPDGSLLSCIRKNSPVGRTYPGDVLLWSLPAPAEVRALAGHVERVNAVALNKAGTLLASAGSDASIRLWDPLTAQALRPLEGHVGPVRGVAFRSDGARLASGGDDGTVKVWDLQSGQVIHSMTAFNHKVTGIAFRPDGKRVASSGADGSVRLWEADAGKLLHTFELKDATAGKGRFVAVAFSPDGRRVAAAAAFQAEATERGPFQIWDADSRKELLGWTPHAGPTLALTWSADGKLLATAGADRLVKLWDAATGKLRRTLSGHTGAVNSVAFGPGGREFSASADQTMRVWDAETGQQLLAVPNASEALAVAVDSEGRIAATGSSDRTVRIWDGRPGRDLFTYQGFTSGVLGLAVSSSGKELAAISWGQFDRINHQRLTPGELKCWDVAGARERWTLPHNVLDEYSAHLSFAPTGDQLAGLSWDTRLKRGSAQVWDAANGQSILNIGAVDASYVRSVAYARDGKRLAIASNGSEPKPGRVVIVDVATRKALLPPLAGPKAGITSLAFSPDGRWIAAGCRDFIVYVWDADSGQLKHSLNGHSDAVLSVAFSPDSRRLVSGGSVVKVWDMSTGQETLNVVGHTGEVTIVAFHPDGQRFASASFDRTIKVWDAKTGGLLMTLRGHADCVMAIAFAAGGERLYSASLDRSVKVWDVRGRDEP